MGIFNRQKKPKDLQKQVCREMLNETLEKALFAEADLFDCFPDDKEPFAGKTDEEKIVYLLEKTQESESRIQLAAWSELRRRQIPIPEELVKAVYGVVIEVGLFGGMDYLAAYKDHRARYYNFSGKKIIWEREEADISTMIDNLIQASQATVNVLGLWTEERRKGVSENMVRLTFLTPAGIYFGEGMMSALLNDPLSQQILSFAVELMKGLMAKAEQQEKMPNNES